jgi:peptidoglycan/xylan/chitin deacetylase (PgdA/CDA1 family)
MDRFLILIVLSLLPTSIFAAGGKRLAITVDDVPVASATPVTGRERQAITSGLLAALNKHGATAVGFVNEDKLLAEDGMDANVALLKAWLDHGMELGNHTFGHLGMHENDLPRMKAAVLKGEAVSRWLSERAGRPYRYFRHPYTQTGNSMEDMTSFENFLASHGYTVAPFTIEHTDYVYSCIYDFLAAGLEPGIEQDELLHDYLEHLRGAVDAFETMSDEIFGRPIPHIWLIHANRINARSLDASLALLREQGYTFITLEEALEDPAYRTQAGPSKRHGPSWLLRWARSLDVKTSVYGQPEPSARVMSAYRAVCE